MKYSGGCHCGTVRYEVEMEIEKVISCNCSICSKKAHLLAFVPEDNFKLLSGDSDLQDYQFAKKTIHHYFCKHCGVSSFGAGTMPNGPVARAINIRCLDNVDINDYPVTHYDGKSL
ncbi:MAG: GFA family protein [Myxococcales bacterium]|nr:MAG: GFA family protein [Myxococcales bacterium]